MGSTRVVGSTSSALRSHQTCPITITRSKPTTTQKVAKQNCESCVEPTLRKNMRDAAIRQSVCRLSMLPTMIG